MNSSGMRCWFVGLSDNAVALYVRAITNTSKTRKGGHMRARLLCFVSRTANLLTGGSPKEYFCTRIYRQKWSTIKYIDGAWYTITGEEQHCRRCYVWDVMKNKRPR